MPDPSTDDESKPSRFETPARLLKGTVGGLVVLGALLVAWIIDKALRHPEIRASQLGAMAPLWMPFAIFVTAGMALIARLFWRAARRVEAGEDLFAKRHRRRPGEEEH